MFRRDALVIVNNLPYRKGMIPYDGVYSNADNEWRWYRCQSVRDLEALLKIFDSSNAYSLSEFTDVLFPTWICVYASPQCLDFEEMDADGDVQFIPLSLSKNSFSELLLSLDELWEEREITEEKMKRYASAMADHMDKQPEGDWMLEVCKCCLKYLSLDGDLSDALAGSSLRDEVQRIVFDEFED